MKHFLRNIVPEVVGHGSDEYALRKIADLRRGNHAVKLGVDACGFIFTADIERLPLLHDFSEAFGEDAGRVAYDLPGNNVSYDILYDFAFVFAVIACKLGKVLHTQTDGYAVASGSSDKVVQTFEENGRQLVYHDAAFEFSLAVYGFHDARVVKAQCRRIDILAVGVAAHAKDFRGFGVIQVECEIVARHDPIKRGRDNPRQRDLRGRDLPLQLLLCAALPGIDERTQIVLQFGPGHKDREHFFVFLVQQFDCVGKGAIFPVLIDAQKPDNRREQHDG